MLDFILNNVGTQINKLYNNDLVALRHCIVEMQVVYLLK